MKYSNPVPLETWHSHKRILATNTLFTAFKPQHAVCAVFFIASLHRNLNFSLPLDTHFCITLD